MAIASIQDTQLHTTLKRHIDALSILIGARPVGSAGNERAAAHIATAMAGAGLAVDFQPFDCIDWQLNGALVELDGQILPVKPNNYSAACDVTGPIVAVQTLDDLAARDLDGKVLVLHGGLSADPWLPRHFHFFSIREQLRLIDMLEHKRPLAIITVSPRNEHVRPIIEDGDFTLPSITVNAQTGARLIAAEGQPVHVRIDCAARSTRAANVLGRTAHPARTGALRVLCCAHFDTKHGTPGALDNASGVATMLALAHMLHDDGAVQLECVALNGKDHYRTPGQLAYQAQLAGAVGELDLVINFDDVGYQTAPNTIAFMGCTDGFADAVRHQLPLWPGMREIGPWPQGDHMAFWSAGAPCVAFTSEASFALSDRITHTPRDVADNLNLESLVELVHFAREAVLDTAMRAPARRRR